MMGAQAAGVPPPGPSMCCPDWDKPRAFLGMIFQCIDEFRLNNCLFMLFLASTKETTGMLEPEETSQRKTLKVHSYLQKASQQDLMQLLNYHA